MYVLYLCFNAEYGTYRSAKTVYCINCILFFVRVLSFYTASSYLGPKLVMIARMVRKLFASFSAIFVLNLQIIDPSA